MRVRSERTSYEQIAVTGADEGIGAAVHDRLAQRPGHRPPRGLAGAEPALVEQLVGVDTLVHLDVTWDVTLPAAQRQARTVRGTALAIEASLAAGVRRVVIVTSADVYGQQPLPVLDDTPLLGGADDADDAAVVGDHVEVERLAAHAARSGLAVAVLRPATLVAGRLGAGYDGQLLRQLAGPRLLAVRGVEPLWQLCHTDDLVEALERVVTDGRTGGFAVACDGALTQTVVEALTGRRRLELPAVVALSLAERLRRVGVTTSSPRELDHLLVPRVVLCDGLRAVGWEPRWTNEQALLAHLAERPADGAAGRAAVGAAGTTVALVGTAALVRRRRGRRG